MSHISVRTSDREGGFGFPEEVGLYQADCTAAIYLYLRFWCKVYTRNFMFTSPEGGFYWHTWWWWCSCLQSHVQVRANPCGAHGGADWLPTTIWNGTERKLACCLMERFLTLRPWARCFCAGGLMSRGCNQSARDDWWAGAPHEFPGQHGCGLGTLVTIYIYIYILGLSVDSDM